MAAKKKKMPPVSQLHNQHSQSSVMQSQALSARMSALAKWRHSQRKKP